MGLFEHCRPTTFSHDRPLSIEEDFRFSEVLERQGLLPGSARPAVKFSRRTADEGNQVGATKKEQGR